MNRILVTGSNGQLGCEIKELAHNHLNCIFFFTDSNTLDITNFKAVELFIEEHEITAIINCAAYTAVDKAESEQEVADKINHLAVKHLAEMAKKYQCKFIHISTDYVFDGNAFKPYIETIDTNPQSIYGSTKLAGEKALVAVKCPNSVIIRTSWVYSSFGNNFVKTMIKLAKEREELGVIVDQIGTPTYARDLAKVLLDILPQVENSETEIFHYSNEGVCSWYDFAKAIFDHTNMLCKLNPLSTEQYYTVATRPRYSVLNKSKIKDSFQIFIPHWNDSLKDCLNIL